MSHWQSGKMGLKCSLTILQRALIKIMPEWEKHIKIDPNAGLNVRGMQGGKSGFSLVIPYGSGTGISYEDIGFKKADDGSWETARGTYIPVKVKNLENKVSSRVAEMKSKQNAINMGFRPTGQVEEGGKIRIRMRGPVPDRYKIRA